MIMGDYEDSDVGTLAMLSGSIAGDYLRSIDDPWVGSPFEWILKIPSRSKGAVGEKLVAGWAATRGLDVMRPPNSDADRIINGHRVEVKMSTLWANGGFKFQQIRNQDYDYCLCLGISPFDAQAWLLPKSLLLERVIGHMGQHTGTTGTDTAWLGFRPESPYPWLEPYGDRLADVFRLLSAGGRGPY